MAPPVGPNSSRSFEELGLDELHGKFRRERLLTVPATEIAREHLGRPLPNAVLIGAFAAQSGLISIDSVAAAIRQKFPGPVGEKNVIAAAKAYEHVTAERESPAHA